MTVASDVPLGLDRAALSRLVGLEAALAEVLRLLADATTDARDLLEQLRHERHVLLPQPVEDR